MSLGFNTANTVGSPVQEFMKDGEVVAEIRNESIFGNETNEYGSLVKEGQEGLAIRHASQHFQVSRRKFPLEGAATQDPEPELPPPDLDPDQPDPPGPSPDEPAPDVVPQVDPPTPPALESAAVLTSRLGSRGLLVTPALIEEGRVLVPRVK